MIKFSEEDLKTAVKQSTSHAEVLRKIGGSPLSFCHIKSKIKEYRLDTSHFKWGFQKYSKEYIEEAVKNSRGYTDVARFVGLAPIGGNTCHMRNLIREFGIDISHFVGQAHGKGKAARNRLAADKILKIYPVGNSRIRTGLLKRALLEIGRKEKCEECGLELEWNNKKLNLTIDHKDGNYLNCIEKNLRFLCPNCHSQTSTYGSKNRTAKVEIEKEQVIIEEKKEEIGREITDPNVHVGDKLTITKEELSKLVWEKSTSELGKQFGVCDNAIGRLCKKWNISKPGVGYWAKIYATKEE